MSFSSGVKEELAIQASQARHCRIALIAAMFHQCPVLTKDMAGIRTENEALVRAFENELRRAGFDPVRDEGSGSRISVVIHGEKKVRTFLEMIKLYDRIAPELCGDQVVFVADIDAEIAGRDERRRADEDMNLLCACLAKQSYDVLGGFSADYRVVNDDDPLALYICF